ncbi:hypothetical protein NMY22_g10640 [Coprinellus aureogranulatus]|nr:hypothetical protein NMY22_g10640 [Coprinellus aureogranulatus]
MSLDASSHTLYSPQSRPSVYATDNGTLGSPFNSLPTDVLFSIFLACLGRLARQSYPRSKSHPVFALSQVSREWRELALSTSALWSVIDVDIPPLGELDGTADLDLSPWKTVALPSLRRWIEHFLSRSGEHPLSVRLTVPRVPSETQVHTEIGSLFGLLCTHAKRWKVVQLTSEGRFPEFLVHLLVSLRPPYLPQLESVVLKDQSSHHYFGPSFEIGAANTGSSRNLKLSITLSTNYIGDSGRRIDRFVEDWGLVSPPTVSTLHFFPPDILQLLHVLEQYPNLLKCSLDTSQFPNRYPAGSHADVIQFAHAADKKVHLPQLEDLDLRGHCLVPELSPFFDAPQLRILSIDPRMSEDSEISFLEWGSKFGAQLTHVTIGAGVLSPDNLLTFVRGMVSLTHLKVLPTRERWTEFTHTVWQGLTPKLGELDNPCPKLQVLLCPMPKGVVMERSPLEQALVAFVVARRFQARTVHTQVAELTELSLAFPRGSALGLKARLGGILREKGVSMDGFLLDIMRIIPLKNPSKGRLTTLSSHGELSVQSGASTIKAANFGRITLRYRDSLDVHEYLKLFKIAVTPANADVQSSAKRPQAIPFSTASTTTSPSPRVHFMISNITFTPSTRAFAEANFEDRVVPTVDTTSQSPFNSLPTDILFSIFLTCLEWLRQHPPSSPGLHPMVTLSRVSREWRQLALGMPALWSVIDLDVPPPPAKAVDLDSSPWSMVTIPALKGRANIFLSRSGQVPLTIRLAIPKMPFYGTYGDQFHDKLGSLFGLLCMHASRWKSVQIVSKGSFEGLLVHLLASLQPERLSKLERLALHDHFHRDDHPPSLYLITRTPSSRLQLSISVSTSYNSETLNNLFIGQGRLVNPSMVSTLHLAPYTIVHLVHAVKQYPKLDQCSLTIPEMGDVISSFANAEGNIIDLSQLENLELRSRRLPRNLSSLFHLPQLNTLSLDPRMSTDSETSFLEWSMKFGVQLTHVTIGGSTLSRESLLTFLQEMPELTNLKVLQTRSCRTTFDHTVWQGLTPKLNPPGRVTANCLCPKLQVLYCPLPIGIVVERSRLEKGLVSFVVAKRAATDYHQVAQISELRLGFPDTAPPGFKARFTRLLREKEVNEDGFLLEITADPRNG